MCVNGVMERLPVICPPATAPVSMSPRLHQCKKRVGRTGYSLETSQAQSRERTSARQSQCAVAGRSSTDTTTQRDLWRLRLKEEKMKSSILASSSAVDCFHDDSDDESHDAISDVEWSRLKSSHLKEGFRDGHSAGQEAALQEAFNEGFSHQVKIDAQDALYKGILTALKTYSEREKHSNRPRPGLIKDFGSRTDSLLVQLDTVAKNISAEQRIPGEAIVTNKQSKSGVKGDDFADLRDNLSGNVPHDGQNATTCCGDSNPSGCQCLQHASEGVSSHGKTDSSSVGCDKTKSDCSAGGGCCKSTHPQENVCMSGVPEGGLASEGTACCKGNQESYFTEPNPSEKHSQSSQSEGGVGNVGTELNQEVLMMEISRKCRHLLTELNMDQLLDDLQLD